MFSRWRKCLCRWHRYDCGRDRPRPRRSLGAFSAERLEHRRLLTFAPPVNYPLANLPFAIAEGDFRGDGKLDLVTANGFIGNEPDLKIFLGNGDGTFQPPVSISVGHGGASALAVGDFNRDGKLDIAAANFGGQSVGVLMGNGDGTFQSAVSYPVGMLPGAVIVGGLLGYRDSIAVGDLNGDGKLDIVTANANVKDVSVLLGNGDGTFQPSKSFAVDKPPPAVQFGVYPVGPDSVAVGDLNADGKLDLVVANGDAQDVSVLLGNGDGTFQPAVNYAVGGELVGGFYSNPSEVVVCDFNH